METLGPGWLHGLIEVTRPPARPHKPHLTAGTYHRLTDMWHLARVQVRFSSCPVLGSQRPCALCFYAHHRHAARKLLTGPVEGPGH
jgi:hypothetical protein